MFIGYSVCGSQKKKQNLNRNSTKKETQTLVLHSSKDPVIIRNGRIITSQVSNATLKKEHKRAPIRILFKNIWRV
jgi:hypothetical protein